MYPKTKGHFMDHIEITIPGEPVPKGRPRFTRFGGVYTPKRTRDYERLIGDIYKEDYGDFMFPEDAPLSVTIQVYTKIPSSASKKRRAAMMSNDIPVLKRPDVDNYSKVIDGLNGICFPDDKQITDLKITKRWSDDPCMKISIKIASGHD